MGSLEESVQRWGGQPVWKAMESLCKVIRKKTIAFVNSYMSRWLMGDYFHWNVFRGWKPRSRTFSEEATDATGTDAWCQEPVSERNVQTRTGENLWEHQGQGKDLGVLFYSNVKTQREEPRLKWAYKGRRRKEKKTEAGETEAVIRQPCHKSGRRPLVLPHSVRRGGMQNSGIRYQIKTSIKSCVLWLEKI